MDNDNKDITVSIKLPLLPLRDVVIFPNMMLPLFVGREKSIAALNMAMEDKRKIFLIPQKDPRKDDPDINDLYKIGTIATILQLLKLPDGTVKVLIEGGERATIDKVYELRSYLQADVVMINKDVKFSNKSIVLSRTIVNLFKTYSRLSKKISDDVCTAFAELKTPDRIVDTVASHISMRMEEKQKIMELVDLVERQEYVIGILETEIDLLEVEKKVRGRVKKQMERSQREYYLTEQMKAIQKELGSDSEQNEMEELHKKITNASMPLEVKKKTFFEFNKLKQMSPMSAEASVIRSYVDWMIKLPWNKKKRIRENLNVAQKLLNKEHYGLHEVKERILEYLAVHKRTKKYKGSVLCFVGPPGVGKTSLGESIARAVNRPFLRISLGGVRDEAEIRGHRRTYIGSMPGRIIQQISRAGVKNPLILLDEIDKMGADMRGDPASALLEVLDTNSNEYFSDHYLEVDYDLSDVMFICTANTLNISPPLLDRMEIIRIPGYTEEEKLNIAKNYLIVKQKKLNGIENHELEFADEAILKLIRLYTKEAGVRNLEREISKTCRKFVKEQLLSNKKDISTQKVKIISENIVHYNGIIKYIDNIVTNKKQIGIVTGLAWTDYGGELLSIEAVVMPGKGNLIKTGSLGDVMQESIQAALTIIKSRATELDLDPLIFEQKDLHIHVPEGATPKDGPSAGIAMCTAILSILKSWPVKALVAMTGEINLRGQVLPIGGLKEKLLAAHRGEIKVVIIPYDNMKDLQDISPEVKKSFTIYPVKWFDEVIDLALTGFSGRSFKKREVVVVDDCKEKKENTVRTH